ncbi:MAG: iron complex outermembrane receptor protein [Candidatus Azotimanducaceae bacterium]|jgi:iron complex outermembrane receptor protein
MSNLNNKNCTLSSASVLSKMKPVAAVIRSQILNAAMLAGAATVPLVANAQLEEIIVTAQKREQSLQDVSVAVKVLNAKTLDDVGVTNFADYVRYQPNLTASGQGPGNASFYIRGLAVDQVVIGAAEVAGVSPNVALYLDEQPVSTISRNLDLYVADIERIEVLAGPQGTLFGASSQAGNVRLITKKPVHGEFEAGVKVSFSDTKGGEMSNSAEGVINIPLIDDKLAVRMVGYSANQGGYIDNVAGTTSLENNVALGAQTEFIRTGNELYVEDDFNDTSYQGFRISADYIINDEWSVLVQHMRQRLETQGSFGEDPLLGDFKVAHFFPDSLDDEFDQTAITLNGQIGNIDVLYSGSFLNREAKQDRDDNAYTESGSFFPYYSCNATTCFDASYGTRHTVKNDRETHEIRITTPQENRLSFIGGLYYDDAGLQADVRFHEPGILVSGNRFAGSQLSPLPGSTMFNPNPRALGVNFATDVTRGEKQEAIFGEMTYDFIPDTFSATLGLRYYEQEVSLKGSTFFHYGGTNIDELLVGQSPATESDTIIKGNISWTPSEDMLFYGTYSEGFRPGGFNRRGGPAPLNPAVIIPFVYNTDTVESYEFGWKTTMLDNRLRWNGAIYKIDWNDIQLTVTDFTLSNLSFSTNAGAAEIKGLETDLAFSANDNLTLWASISYNDTEITSVPSTVTNVVPVGSQTAFAPELQYTLRGRYDWEMGQYQAHAQLAVQHADESKNSIIRATAATIPSWTTADATIGMSNDVYGMELFIDNLTDEKVVRSIERPETLSPEQYVNRPRTIGIRFNYGF